MNKIDFDDYADNYGQLLQKQLSFFDKKNYFAEYKIKILKQQLNYEPVKILDYGCGTGRNLKFLKQYFPNAKIYGCDISKKSLKIATKNNPDAILFLPNENFDYKNFDLVFVAGVFHHIEPNLRTNILKQIHQLLTKNGSLVIFEHNPYNPVTLHMVNTCEFDDDVVLLKAREMKNLLRRANFALKKTRYSLFIPKFLKKLRFLEKYLGLIPLGGQYFILAQKT